MREIQVICRKCRNEQTATRGARGASIRCLMCSEEIPVPANDQCGECGDTITPGQDVCDPCDREARRAATEMKSIGNRIKTAASGLALGGIGLWIGYTGTWSALATGVQDFRLPRRSSSRVHELITREDSPFWFWVPLGVSSLVCVLMVLFAVVIVVGGVLGKTRSRMSVGRSRRRSGRLPTLRKSSKR